MDNRINEIRKQIRALRVSMLEAEAVMRGQISRDEDCSESAGEMLAMRQAMGLLAEERCRLGDREPIVVNSIFMPAPKPVRPVKRHLVPPHNLVPARVR